MSSWKVVDLTPGRAGSRNGLLLALALGLLPGSASAAPGALAPSGGFASSGGPASSGGTASSGGFASSGGPGVRAVSSGPGGPERQPSCGTPAALLGADQATLWSRLGHAGPRRGALPELAPAQEPGHLNGDSSSGDPSRRGPLSGGSDGLEGPAGGAPKVHYGTPYDTRVDTPNFTINWVDPGDATEAIAQQAGVALEQAWAALIEQQGWPLPVSSDDFLLWVILDPTLGNTGLTSEFETPEYPEGYPVIFLDPYWAKQPDFFHALAQHELMHAIQFAQRGVWSAEAVEAWYWEASAQWAPELVDPEQDAYADAARWYADDPELRFDSLEGYHQYGMVVFNAWLHEAFGPALLQDVWNLSGQRPGVAWDLILEEASGESAADLWGDFAVAFGNEWLVDSPLYATPRRDGLGVGGDGAVQRLGTSYWVASTDTDVTLEVEQGEALLVGPGGAGPTLTVFEDEVLAVVGLSEEEARYRLVVEDSPPSLDPDPTGCTCAQGPDESGPLGGGLWAALLLLWGYRRRPEEPRPAPEASMV